VLAVDALLSFLSSSSTPLFVQKILRVIVPISVSDSV
jgi:hypothetical protein